MTFESVSSRLQSQQLLCKLENICSVHRHQLTTSATRWKMPFRSVGSSGRDVHTVWTPVSTVSADWTCCVSSGPPWWEKPLRLALKFNKCRHKRRNRKDKSADLICYVILTLLEYFYNDTGKEKPETVRDRLSLTETAAPCWCGDLFPLRRAGC